MMKFLITFLALTLLPISQAFSSDVDVDLKFDNPVRDCKTYVPKKEDVREIFSNISGLKIIKTETNGEVFAALKIGVAFGKCTNGKWVRSAGTPIFTRASVERGTFGNKTFALNATYTFVDTVNDGRTTEYSSHILLGLDVSVTKILDLLESGQNKVEARARYSLINGGTIFVSYTFTRDDNGEIAIAVKTLK
jgi:hypothetical protein